MKPWHEEPNNCVAFCTILAALTDEEANSVDILPPNVDAEDVDHQRAVEVSADWTDYEPRRFYGRTLLDAMIKAGVEQAKHR